MLYRKKLKEIREVRGWTLVTVLMLVELYQWKPDGREDVHHKNIWGGKFFKYKEEEM